VNAYTESLGTATALIRGADAVFWQVVALSLQVSGLASVFGVVLGMAAGALLAVSRFPGHRALVLLPNTLLALGLGHGTTALAQAFADWIVAPAGQAAIASCRINGERVFFAYAGP